MAYIFGNLEFGIAGLWVCEDTNLGVTDTNRGNCAGLWGTDLGVELSIPFIA